MALRVSGRFNVTHMIPSTTVRSTKSAILLSLSQAKFTSNDGAEDFPCLVH
jgi:hypothetical protein